MGIWPFGRNSTRKRKASAAVISSESLMTAQPDPERQEKSLPGLERKKSGTGKSTRKPVRETRKLQRNPEKRAYSFSPGRNDTIRVPKDIHRTHPVPPIPPSAANMTQGTRDGEQEWKRIPTLHKRSANDLPRRKSSKKRKEDHDREAEIKAMSATMPTRAATEYGIAGRPMKRESKKMRQGLGRNLTNPSSDISLPTAESVHSSMSSDADKHASYELKGMDVFSPWPTIRYAENPRMTNVISTVQQGSPSRKLPDRDHISDELLNANKRIDDLADDLDAGSLRELMERDQRRRERKKFADREKTERKLARKAEKQRLAEAEAATNGTSPPQNMERGVLGRELVGLGIDGETSAPKRKASDASSKRRGKLPAHVDPTASNTSIQNPFSDFHRSDSLPPTEPGSPVDEGEELVIGTAQVARLSRASMSPPASPKGHARGPSNISELMDLSKIATSAPTEKPETNRRNSDDGTRQHQSWTSIFKRNTKQNAKQKRNSIPTSFSNTSRDSTPTSQPPPAVVAPRASLLSGVPKRTMSRFREDLPELPLSPPDSRIQSPEADIVPPIRPGILEKKGIGRVSTDNPLIDTSLRRHDTPTSGYRSLEQPSRNRNETPTSVNRSDVPSPEPSAIMSQSLASIDSEGSWLSGRPRAGSKRSSAQAPHHQSRDSNSSLQKRYKDYSGSTEELGIGEDEYFSRLSPGPDDDFGEMSRRRASGNPMPSSDEEDEDSIASPRSTKWGAVARTPTIVHRDLRAKSREVLINDYENDSPSEPPGETPLELADRSSYGFDGNNKPLPEDPAIVRASSVNLSKGHVRHISAGSARLLDLKPRASGEAKRGNADQGGGA